MSDTHIDLRHDRSGDYTISAAGYDADTWVAAAILDDEIVADVAAPTIELALSALAHKMLIQMAVAKSYVGGGVPVQPAVLREASNCLRSFAALGRPVDVDGVIALADKLTVLAGEAS
jgi:hypothetical protein